MTSDLDICIVIHVFPIYVPFTAVDARNYDLAYFGRLSGSMC